MKFAKELTLATTSAQMAVLIDEMQKRECLCIGMCVSSANPLTYRLCSQLLPESCQLLNVHWPGTSAAAKFLRKNGITLFGIRDETVKLLGKADMYFFSPEHPPLTQPAQDALDWALDEKSRLGEYILQHK